MARILVVDDEPFILKALSEILESMGHSVLTASNGREGLAMFRSLGFDIVISDLRMPGMDGLEVLMRVRNLDSRAGVVLITGHSTIETLVNATNKGVDAYITKPFKVNEIEEILDRITGERRFHRSDETDPDVPPGLLRRTFRRLLSAF